MLCSTGSMHEPWVAAVMRDRDAVRLRLADSWIETAGAALEAGGSGETPLADLAEGRHFSVQFWDANATKALHIGHLRNLAIGNALAAALSQAGAQVERRSRISDMGRAMGEAMAGVMRSGRHAQGWSDGEEKSDHFVGACYADYVAAGTAPIVGELEVAEDSLSREVQVQNDDADELIKRVLQGRARGARALVQDARLGDRRAAQDARAARSRLRPRPVRVRLPRRDGRTRRGAGSRSGTLRRREDGVVVYVTGLEELEEVPLVRADGLSTQHVRSLTYAMTAPELEGMTSLQVTGSEWVAHVTSIRKLALELRPELNGGFHPSRSIFHGMVSSEKRALTSSAGALLIDELAEWLDEQIDGDPTRRAGAPHPPGSGTDRGAARARLLPAPPRRAPTWTSRPSGCCASRRASAGTWRVRVRATAGRAPPTGARRRTPTIASRWSSPSSTAATCASRCERLDVRPLAHYLKHLAIWYLERERGEHVERVVHTLLDRSARGLGLDVTA